MTGEEIAVWLSNFFGELTLTNVEGRRLAFATVNDGTRVAVTSGFSDVDTGLTLQEETSVDVRCELAVGSRTASDAELAAVLIGAWDALAAGGGLAQPGTVLLDVVKRTKLHELAGPHNVTVKHGLLREPTWFDQGTPHYREPGRMTLLLEVAMLTEEEYNVATERGLSGLDTRLRRRGTDLGDLRRDADAEG